MIGSHTRAEYGVSGQPSGGYDWILNIGHDKSNELFDS